MYSLILSIAILIIGYFIYGKFIARYVGVDDNIKTPAITHNDGVDYVPINKKRLILIHFLNIAGLGPIFGAIQGALFGPIAFVWIVLGTIFAGGVHDFLTGHISIKHKGESIPELVGYYLGKHTRILVFILFLIFLTLSGSAFTTASANLLTSITGIPIIILIIIMFVYYLLATLLSIDKIIGRIYPIFGIILIIMAIGIFISLLYNGYQIPEINLNTLNMNISPYSIFPYLFVTIACGAISGGHSTQTPLSVRCIEKETDMRLVFYGAMVAEGILALIWAAATMAFIHGQPDVGMFFYQNPTIAIDKISIGLLGTIGGLLAIMGVVICPITTSDTSFRSIRLNIADYFNIKQDKISSRVLIVLPFFIIAFILCFVNFNVVWRYFVWINQLIATIILILATRYLIVKKKNCLITAIPCAFMIMVVIAYILQAKEGLQLDSYISNIIGVVLGIALMILLIYYFKRNKIPQNKITI